MTSEGACGARADTGRRPRLPGRPVRVERGACPARASAKRRSGDETTCSGPSPTDRCRRTLPPVQQPNGRSPAAVSTRRRGRPTGPPATSTSTPSPSPRARRPSPPRTSTLRPVRGTAWHTHPHGQTIFVTEGVGRCQREGRACSRSSAPATAVLRARREPLARRRTQSLHGPRRHRPGRRVRQHGHLGRPCQRRAVRRSGRLVRLARPDDRRPGVLVHAVRLAISTSSRPAAGAARANSRRVSAPAMQPVQAAMSRRVAASMSSSAITSETAKRPPGRSTRAASAITALLVGREVDHAVGDDHVDARVRERQLLDIALEELDVGRRPASRALARASSSISSVMSSPIALPVGPTRRAEIRTSAPAPEPRSSTVSPSWRSATAVGTPQPSEAAPRVRRPSTRLV